MGETMRTTIRLWKSNWKSRVLAKLILFLEQPARAIIMRLILYSILVYVLAIIYAVLFVTVRGING